MISEVDICNLALTKLGTKTIVSLTESSEEARRCNIIYESSRDSVLRSHKWGFATKIEVLSELSGESVVGWDYTYIYPKNCLFIIKLFNETNIDTNNYKKLLSPLTNTQIIATNIDEAYIEYIKRITDPNLFDALFIEAFVYKLASELAMSITGEQSLANSFLNTYSLVIGEAKKINASEKNAKIIRKSSFIEAR